MCITVAITGFTQGVGRTSMIAALAKTYSTLGKRVLAIDADGDGTLGDLLQVVEPIGPSSSGLSELLKAGVDSASVVKETSSPNLWHMGAGDQFEEIDEAFADTSDDFSSATRRAVDLLRPLYDVVLLDTPADKSESGTFVAIAGADVLLTLAPPGCYGAQATPDEVQDLRLIRETINPNLRYAGTVLVDTQSGVPMDRSRALAQALGKLAKFI